MTEVTTTSAAAEKADPAVLVLLTGGPRGSINMRVGTDVRFIRDTLTRGLYIIVGKRTRIYAVKVRVRGVDRQYVVRIGDIRSVDLMDARIQARAIIEAAQLGQMPEAVTAREERRAAAEAAANPPPPVGPNMPFVQVAQAYLDDNLRGGGAKLASRPELVRKLNRDLAVWHDRAIGSLTRAEIKALIREKAQQAPISSNRTLSFVKRVFAWAEDMSLIEENPAAGIRKPGAESTRDRFLDDGEIVLFWRACEAVGEPIGRLYRLLLVLGQRRGETAGMLRSELRLLEHRDRTGKVSRVDGWSLPATRTKRRREHNVPLSPLARVLLDQATPATDETGALYDHVFATGVCGDGPPSGWSKFKSVLDEEIGRLAAAEAGEPYDPETHNIPAFNIHDLRATCATHMAMEGVDDRVISRILNHAEGDGKSMTKKYQRYTYDNEALEALTLWGEKIERLCCVASRKPATRNAA